MHHHPGRCAADCAHGLAVHICRTHCDVYEQCRELASNNPDMWDGMVVGGLMWHTKISQMTSQPKPRIRCSACPFREKVFHE